MLLTMESSRLAVTPKEGSSQYVVETSGLSKRFGDRTVVSDVNLYVPRGVAFGYLGTAPARPR